MGPLAKRRPPQKPTRTGNAASSVILATDSDDSPKGRTNHRASSRAREEPSPNPRENKIRAAAVKVFFMGVTLKRLTTRRSATRGAVRCISRLGLFTGPASNRSVHLCDEMGWKGGSLRIIIPTHTGEKGLEARSFEQMATGACVMDATLANSVIYVLVVDSMSGCCTAIVACLRSIDRNQIRTAGKSARCRTLVAQKVRLFEFTDTYSRHRLVQGIFATRGANASDSPIRVHGIGPNDRKLSVRWSAGMALWLRQTNGGSAWESCVNRSVGWRLS
jgi:hypothetical protein